MLPLSLPLILSTFGIIFIAELPDKTALASLVLATKYRAHQVIIGSCLAMLVQTMIAVSAGELLTFSSCSSSTNRVWSRILILRIARLQAKGRKARKKVKKRRS